MRRADPKRTYHLDQIQEAIDRLIELKLIKESSRDLSSGKPDQVIIHYIATDEGMDVYHSNLIRQLLEGFLK